MDPAPLPAKSGAEASALSPEKKDSSAEEQMAQFEEELKETDWGHQPC